MAFTNSNKVLGIPPNSAFQQGRADVDNNQDIENGFVIPWMSDPACSYLYYDCVIGVMLDSGIVVHNRLPQVNRTPDTLGSVLFDDPTMDQVLDKGVNLKSNDQYQDIVQRMGHSRYWFRIWGQALRIGYQVPIPLLKTIGGVAAIPYDKNPQWGYNAICPGANYGGIILWRAQWSLWYTTAVPPTSNTIPAVDPSAHITGNTPLPQGIQSPYSEADDNAQNNAPGKVGGGGFGGAIR